VPTAYHRIAGTSLGRLAPQLLSYLLSFLTLGIFWVGQQTQLNQLARSNRDLTWIYLGFLLAVSLMPFSTGRWPSSSPSGSPWPCTG